MAPKIILFLLLDSDRYGLLGTSFHGRKVSQHFFFKEIWIEYFRLQKKHNYAHYRGLFACFLHTFRKAAIYLIVFIIPGNIYKKVVIVDTVLLQNHMYIYTIVLLQSNLPVCPQSAVLLQSSLNVPYLYNLKLTF